ncbi:MAG: hypothetical protein DRN81_04225 [Thermoproteota archaeon]|nr:MAG: hypothetical protein DRN81_04225 [Candidatus Korarchaeota archaeon]
MAIALPTVRHKGRKYFVDFRLEELRDVKTARRIKFTELKATPGSYLKKRLRVIRFKTFGQRYMKGLDDPFDSGLNKAVDDAMKRNI